MLKLPDLFSLSKQTRKLCHSWIIASFTVATLLGGIVSSGVKANAQNPAINEAELLKFARTILAMEPARQEAFDNIKKIIVNGEVPKIVCNDSNSFNALPGKAKDIAVNYCNRSQKIVEENGLSVDRFNKITVEVQSNEGLQKKVSEQLMRLQEKPGS